MKKHDPRMLLVLEQLNPTNPLRAIYEMARQIEDGAKTLEIAQRERAKRARTMESAKVTRVTGIRTKSKLKGGKLARRVRRRRARGHP